MAEKKKVVQKQQPKKTVKVTKESKWTTGKGVPVDAKKVKWAAKY